MKKGKEPETISGEIVALFCDKEKFQAGIINTKDGSKKFSGKTSVAIHDRVILTGSWRNNPQYGQQFKATSAKHVMNMDSKGLRNYLQNNPAFKGIGPAKAEKIAQKFGSNFHVTLNTNPNAIKEAGGLSDDNMKILKTEWNLRGKVNEASVWLAQYELTDNQIKRLIEKYPENIQEVLKNDPYIICKEVNGIGFIKNDEIALKSGTRRDHPMRINAALLYVLADEVESGHTWSEKKQLFSKSFELLRVNENEISQVMWDQFYNLQKNQEIMVVKHPEHDNQELVALPYLYQREKQIYELFIRSKNYLGQFTDQELDKLLEGTELNQAQQLACRIALTGRITMVSGKAGSGKSFTLARMVEFCDKKELSVVLAAPTGKAAKRIEELSGNGAKTIHRLLGYNGSKWDHDRDNKIVADVIIIDECSMIDVNLAWRFFDAVDLQRTQVVLVGDPNQLQPVGPGNMLRDAIKRRLIPQVVLTQVVRQAGILKNNCNSILSGIVNKSEANEEIIKSPWLVYSNSGDQEGVLDGIIKTIKKLFNAGIDITNDLQVLTPMKKGTLGTVNLNNVLQELYQHLIYSKAKNNHKKADFYIGDKVMQLQNDYKIDVMNGAVGIIKDIRQERNDKGKEIEIMRIDFDGKVVDIATKSEQARKLGLSYACTIHKYQGSEIEHSIVIMHSSHFYMSHRNLFYTAVTRSKQSCFIFGDTKGIYTAAKKQVVDSRRTFMSILK